MNSTQEINSNRTIPLFIGTVLFYIATVLPHETVGAFIGSFFANVSREVYDQTMFVFLSVGIMLFAIFVLRSLLKNHDRLKLGILYLTITIGLAIVAMKLLVVINVEFVHFIQYGILSILVFFLVRRYEYTAWIILFMALLDESYQHFFLTPNTFQYLDFNDILLDQIGAGFGLSTLFCLKAETYPRRKNITRTLVSAYLLLFIICVGLYLSGTLRIWPTEGEPLAPIQVMHQDIEGFWQKVRKVHRYHIVRPLEGACLSIFLALIYSGLDRLSR